MREAKDDSYKQSVWQAKIAGCQADVVENAKCTKATKLLRKIIDYPIELNKFTYRELKDFLEEAFGDQANSLCSKSSLNYLVKIDILDYDTKRKEWCVNHSNYYKIKLMLSEEENTQID